MSNRDRAAKVLAQDRCWIPGPGGMERFSVAEGADALAAAGVLAPDLPEPTRVGPDFTHWGPVALERDTGAIAIGVSGPYTQDPDEARAWAKYLAAAADHVDETLGDTDD